MSFRKTLLAVTMMALVVIGCQTTDNPVGTCDITTPTTSVHSGIISPPAPPDLPDPWEVGQIHNRCMDWCLSQRPEEKDLGELIRTYFGNDSESGPGIAVGIQAVAGKKELTENELVRLLQTAQHEKYISAREQQFIRDLVDVSFENLPSDELYARIQEIYTTALNTGWYPNERLAPAIISITMSSLDWHCSVSALDFNWGSFGRADLVGAIIGGCAGAASGAGAVPGAVGGACLGSMADALNQFFTYL
jgi:hypothetical protein